jgi:hypothetical protein
MRSGVLFSAMIEYKREPGLRISFLLRIYPEESLAVPYAPA